MAGKYAGRYMDHGAAPCRYCGTEGGALGDNTRRPWRGRGCCHSCYLKAWRQGFPEQLVRYYGPHVTPPPATVDLDTLIPRVRLPWGATQTPAWQRAVAWERRRAEEWTAARRERAA